VRIIAILAAYNEERFIVSCVEHLVRHGVEVYLIDNDSTDQTVEIAEKYCNRGLIGIERLARAGVYSWRPILERKEELALALKADWFIHLDPDEIRLPPSRDATLAEAFSRVEAEGYNAVNFLEYTFIPPQEDPDHDHLDFLKTMRWYYPFLPFFPHRLTAWKKQPVRVELAWSGGHQVRFPGLRTYPLSFPMRHYLFLSVAHAIRKYVYRHYDKNETESGLHGWRATLKPEMINLPSQKGLRLYTSDDLLDPSNPRTQHYLEEIWGAQKAGK
jgi:glycosyltransferase involved in cell wall biosynthesis